MLNSFESSGEELKYHISILFLIPQVSNRIDQNALLFFYMPFRDTSLTPFN